MLRVGRGLAQHVGTFSQVHDIVDVLQAPPQAWESRRVANDALLADARPVRRAYCGDHVLATLGYDFERVGGDEVRGIGHIANRQQHPQAPLRVAVVPSKSA